MGVGVPRAVPLGAGGGAWPRPAADGARGAGWSRRAVPSPCNNGQRNLHLLPCARPRVTTLLSALTADTLRITAVDSVSYTAYTAGHASRAWRLGKFPWEKPDRGPNQTDTDTLRPPPRKRKLLFPHLQFRVWSLESTVHMCNKL